MKLIDPTVQGSQTQYLRAPKLPSVDGLTIGLLTNGKVNADVLLKETAALFADRNNCEITELFWKQNASAPAESDTLEAVAAKCDFMITAMGD